MTPVLRARLRVGVPRWGHGRGRRALRAIAASRPRTAKAPARARRKVGERTAPQPPADEVRRWDSSRVKETCTN